MDLLIIWTKQMRASDVVIKVPLCGKQAAANSFALFNKSNGRDVYHYFIYQVILTTFLSNGT